ncbi:UNVERIFIED_CONTAM: hypothetical protein HDU68_000437 [Siphonaria sp. JEL0065]|nr:hypothetical protein HDU68_000437 [Siphonaria sp. JEL0065]
MSQLPPTPLPPTPPPKVEVGKVDSSDYDHQQQHDKQQHWVQQHDQYSVKDSADFNAVDTAGGGEEVPIVPTKDLILEIDSELIGNNEFWRANNLSLLSHPVNGFSMKPSDTTENPTLNPVVPIQVPFNFADAPLPPIPSDDKADVPLDLSHVPPSPPVKHVEPERSHSVGTVSSAKRKTGFEFSNFIGAVAGSANTNATIGYESGDGRIGSSSNKKDSIDFSAVFAPLFRSRTPVAEPSSPRPSTPGMDRRTLTFGAFRTSSPASRLQQHQQNEVTEETRGASLDKKWWRMTRNASSPIPPPPPPHDRVSTPVQQQFQPAVHATNHAIVSSPLKPVATPSYGVMSVLPYTPEKEIHYVAPKIAQDEISYVPPKLSQRSSTLGSIFGNGSRRGSFRRLDSPMESPVTNEQPVSSPLVQRVSSRRPSFFNAKEKPQPPVPAVTPVPSSSFDDLTEKGQPPVPAVTPVPVSTLNDLAEKPQPPVPAVTPVPPATFEDVTEKLPYVPSSTPVSVILVKTPASIAVEAIPVETAAAASWSNTAITSSDLEKELPYTNPFAVAGQNTLKRFSLFIANKETSQASPIDGSPPKIEASRGKRHSIFTVSKDKSHPISPVEFDDSRSPTKRSSLFGSFSPKQLVSPVFTPDGEIAYAAPNLDRRANSKRNSFFSSSKRGSVVLEQEPAPAIAPVIPPATPASAPIVSSPIAASGDYSFEKWKLAVGKLRAVTPVQPVSTPPPVEKESPAVATVVPPIEEITTSAPTTNENRKSTLIPNAFGDEDEDLDELAAAIYSVGHVGASRSRRETFVVMQNADVEVARESFTTTVDSRRSFDEVIKRDEASAVDEIEAVVDDGVIIAAIPSPTPDVAISMARIEDQPYAEPQGGAALMKFKDSVAYKNQLLDIRQSSESFSFGGSDRIDVDFVGRKVDELATIATIEEDFEYVHEFKHKKRSASTDPLDSAIPSSDVIEHSSIVTKEINSNILIPVEQSLVDTTPMDSVDVGAIACPSGPVVEMLSVENEGAITGDIASPILTVAADSQKDTAASLPVATEPATVSVSVLEAETVAIEVPLPLSLNSSDNTQVVVLESIAAPIIVRNLPAVEVLLPVEFIDVDVAQNVVKTVDGPFIAERLLVEESVIPTSESVLATDFAVQESESLASDGFVAHQQRVEGIHSSEQIHHDSPAAVAPSREVSLTSDVFETLDVTVEETVDMGEFQVVVEENVVLGAGSHATSSIDGLADGVDATEGLVGSEQGGKSADIVQSTSVSVTGVEELQEVTADPIKLEHGFFQSLVDRVGEAVEVVEHAVANIVHFEPAEKVEDVSENSAVHERKIADDQMYDSQDVAKSVEPVLSQEELSQDLPPQESEPIVDNRSIQNTLDVMPGVQVKDETTALNAPPTNIHQASALTEAPAAIAEDIINRAVTTQSRETKLDNSTVSQSPIIEAQSSGSDVATNVSVQSSFISSPQLVQQYPGFPPPQHFPGFPPQQQYPGFPPTGAASGQYPALPPSGPIGQQYLAHPPPGGIAGPPPQGVYPPGTTAEQIALHQQQMAVYYQQMQYYAQFWQQGLPQAPGVSPKIAHRLSSSHSIRSDTASTYGVTPSDSASNYGDAPVSQQPPDEWARVFAVRPTFKNQKRNAFTPKRKTEVYQHLNALRATLAKSALRPESKRNNKALFEFCRFCIQDTLVLDAGERNELLTEAFEILKRQCFQGYSESQFLVGKGYLDDGNYESAYILLYNSAMQSHGQACCQLASMISVGKGVERDDSSAISFFNKGIQAGDIEAAYRLGSAHAYGRLGLAVNFSEALRLLNECAKDPKSEYRPKALFEISRIYELGADNLPKNESIALSALNDSAKGGYLPAITKIAHCYLEGKFGLKSDERKAISLYKTAAELGDETAKRTLQYLQR